MIKLYKQLNDFMVNQPDSPLYEDAFQVSSAMLIDNPTLDLGLYLELNTVHDEQSAKDVYLTLAKAILRHSNTDKLTELCIDLVSEYPNIDIEFSKMLEGEQK